MPRLPGPRRSQKFTQNGGAARTGWEAEAGGRARWEGIWEVEAASRGREDTGRSLEGRRKEPSGVSEAEGRREKPRVAERETGRGGKSRRRRGAGLNRKWAGPHGPETAEADRERKQQGTVVIRKDPKVASVWVAGGGNSRKRPRAGNGI